MKPESIDTCIADPAVDVHIRVGTKAGKGPVESHRMAQGDSHSEVYRAAANAKPRVEFTVASEQYTLKPGDDVEKAGFLFGVEQRNSNQIRVYIERR